MIWHLPPPVQLGGGGVFLSTFVMETFEAPPPAARDNIDSINTYLYLCFLFAEGYANGLAPCSRHCLDRSTLLTQLFTV